MSAHGGASTGCTTDWSVVPERRCIAESTMFASRQTRLMLEPLAGWGGMKGSGEPEVGQAQSCLAFMIVMACSTTHLAKLMDGRGVTVGGCCCIGVHEDEFRPLGTLIWPMATSVTAPFMAMNFTRPPRQSGDRHCRRQAHLRRPAVRRGKAGAQG